MAKYGKSAERSVGGWFSNLKTLPKLIIGFSSVGAMMIVVIVIALIGLNQLKGELQHIYDGSTSALSNVGVSSTNLGLYHSALLSAGRQTRKREFDEAIVPLAALKGHTLAPLSSLHKPSSNDAEAIHAEALQQALKDYFAASEGVLGVFADSFGASLTDDQMQAMRDLGQMTLSVDVANKYGEAAVQMRELMTTVRAVAKDLNDKGQAEADYRTGVVTVGALLALILGGAVGFALARSMARNIIHVADVAAQAAAGNLRA